MANQAAENAQSNKLHDAISSPSSTTTKAAHTPGPWETHTGLDYTVVMLPGQCTEDASIHVFDDNAEANARLIAAAPELLEALEALLDISDFATNSRVGEIHLHAMAAIQKARGGQ